MYFTGSSTTESFLASMLPWLMEPWLRSNTYSQWNKNSRSCRWCYCHHQNKGWYFCGPCWSFRTAKRYYCFQWPDKKLYLLICMANFVASELFLTSHYVCKFVVIWGKISWFLDIFNLWVDKISFPHRK